jgi:hypothetical protein
MHTEWIRNLMRVRQYRTWLTLVVKTVLEGSEQVTKEELQTWYDDEKVMQRWAKNPMEDFFTVLAGALETESRSAENRRKEKERASKKPTLSQPPLVQTLHDLVTPLPPSPSTNIILPETPTSSSISTSTMEHMTNQHKRTASAATTASYGASSTESPPQNIDKPEPHVQELQNTLVRCIMRTIWKGGVPISWAQGRKMWLDYAPYHFSDYRTDCRTDPTSFACLLPDNHTDETNTVRKDRIIANSDGAFIIKTNKKGGGPGRLIWDKQKTAIAFEVLLPFSNMINRRRKRFLTISWGLLKFRN